jgi:hypothetical protein
VIVLKAASGRLQRAAHLVRAALALLAAGCAQAACGQASPGADTADSAAGSPDAGRASDDGAPSVQDGGDASAASDGGPSVPDGGDADTGGRPAAPASFRLTAQTATSTSLSWEAPAPGAAPIDHYRIYRNGVPYDSATGTTYTDHAATSCEVASLDQPATVYDYGVAAVDAAGHEGPQAAQYAVYGYRGAAGGSTWGNSDYSYGLSSLDWADTSGAPVGGGTDIKAVFPPNNGGGFQPYSNAPQVPIYDLDIGAFRYLTFDIKADHGANNFYVAVYSRLPFGDVYTWTDLRIPTYATLADDMWTTVKIPLSDLHMEPSQFTASIGAPYGTFNNQPYATLHVTSLDSGPGIDNGGFVLGTGLSGGVYIVGNGQNGSVGTFNVEGPSITGSTTVASRGMSYQRTNMYKINIGLNDGQPGGNVYFNNIAFTRQ